MKPIVAVISDASRPSPCAAAGVRQRRRAPRAAHRKEFLKGVEGKEEAQHGADGETHKVGHREEDLLRRKDNVEIAQLRGATIGYGAQHSARRTGMSRKVLMCIDVPSSLAADGVSSDAVDDDADAEAVVGATLPGVIGAAGDGVSAGGACCGRMRNMATTSLNVGSARTRVSSRQQAAASATRALDRRRLGEKVDRQRHVFLRCN